MSTRYFPGQEIEILPAGEPSWAEPWTGCVALVIEDHGAEIEVEWRDQIVWLAPRRVRGLP